MLFLLTLLPTADAFRLSGHRMITERAVAAEGMESVGRQLWQGNRAEDVRLGVKWRHFSHYYRPDTPILLPRRGTSDRRVQVLWEAAQRAAEAGDTDAMWVAIGGVIHHVQDMASPPHVVPVAHDLRDGFERYPVADLIATLPLEEPDPLTPVEAHDLLAWNTWEQVQSGALEGCGQSIPLTDIWQAPAAAEFGSYGPVTFGDVGDCPALAGAYETVMSQRLAAAIFFTRAVLQYARGSIAA